MGRLDLKALALAGGVLWSAGILLLGLAAWLFDWGTALVTLFASLYVGYAPTLAGSFIGAAWGFIDGLVCGAAFAWLYNALAK